VTKSKAIDGDDDEDEEWKDDAGMDENAGGNAGHRGRAVVKGKGSDVTKFPQRRVGIRYCFNSLKTNFYQCSPVGPRVPACTYCVANGHACMDWIQKGRGAKAGTSKIAASCTHCAAVKHRCVPSAVADADSGTPETAATPPPMPAPPRVKNAKAKTPAATTKAKAKSAKSSGGVTKPKPKAKAKAKTAAGAGCMFSSLTTRA
jgi:hypothetical protein